MSKLSEDIKREKALDLLRRQLTDELERNIKKAFAKSDVHYVGTDITNAICPEKAPYILSKATYIRKWAKKRLNASVVSVGGNKLAFVKRCD